MSRFLRLSMASWLAWLAVVLVASLPGCQCGSTGVENRRFTCSRDDQCADGFVCTFGECLPPETPGADGGTDGGTDGGVDSGIPDGGETDAGTDGGLPDAGGTDAGPDGGAPDGGPTPKPTKLSFISPPQTVQAGQCSAPLVLETQSSTGSTAPVSASTTISLSTFPNSSFTFYTDATCQTALPTKQVTLSVGSSRATLYFRSNVARSYRVNVAASGLASASQDELIQAGPPTVVAFLTGAQTLPAGVCSPSADLELRDAYGNTTGFSSTTPAALTSQPDPGLLLFSDSGCTQALKDAQFAAGSSRTSFFFKGLTGGTFTLSSAPGGLTPATLGVTILPVVRSGSCRINDGSSSVTCSISPAQLDTTKTLMMFQATSGQDNPESASTACALTAPGAITCSRVGTTGTTRIQWQTAELATGLNVQHLGVTCGASDVTALSIDPVADVQSTFLLVSSQKGGIDLGSDDFYTAELVAPDQVELRFSDICSDTWAASVQVVEFTGATVTRGETSSMTGTQLAVSNLPAADPATTALLFTYRLTGDPAGICDRVLRGELTSPTSITFSRGAGNSNCAGAVIDAISWERIDFGARARASHSVVTMNSGTTFTSVPITAVDTTRTLVFASGQDQCGQGGGESTYASDDLIGASVARHVLSSPTSLDLTRGTTNGFAKWTSTVLELQP